MPAITRLLESSLYVADLDRSLDFYRSNFGFEKIAGDSRFAALSVAGENVLLLFKKGSTDSPAKTPGGVIPPHNGDGALHVAFGIEADELEDWKKKLEARGIPVVSEVNWPMGGKSFYVHDPDGHLVELVTPGVWKIY